MNFTEAVNEVMLIVKRPDKILNIRSQVNNAINFYSMETTFAFDLQEQAISIPTSDYIHSIALSELTRFRKIQTIRPSGKKNLTQISSSDIVDECGKDKTDVWYLAGTQINVRLSNTNSQLLLAYFSYPPILTDAAPSYWMLDISPWMVIHRAAGFIFASIGDDDSAKIHKALGDEAFISAKRDYRYGINVG